MPKGTKTLTNIPQNELDEVVQGFKDEGGTVKVTQQSDGTFTVIATFSDPAIAPSVTPDASTGVGPVASKPIASSAGEPISTKPTMPGNTAGAPFVDLLIQREFETDVDGAPNAYAPPGAGPTLDFELNAHVGAKSTGAIVGYITNPDGSKPTQRGNDPFPGYYISTTAFQDSKNKNDLDPQKYVDASEINYVVRGEVAEEHGVHLGDFVAVHSISKGSSVFGIVGDSGNSSGAEGSLALLQNLGYPFTSGKSGSVDSSDIIVRYFPKSNPNQQFFTAQTQIDNTAAALGLSRDFSTHV